MGVSSFVSSKDDSSLKAGRGEKQTFVPSILNDLVDHSFIVVKSSKPVKEGMGRELKKGRRWREERGEEESSLLRLALGNSLPLDPF